MKTYHRYLLRLWSSNFLLTFCIINSLLLVGNLVRFKKLGLLNLLPILPSLIPAMLIYSLPLSSLMATLFSLSKARQSFEPITFASSGVRVLQWARPLFVIGTGLCILTLCSLEWLQPWGETFKRDYLNDISTNLIKTQLNQKQSEFHFGDEDIFFFENAQGLKSAIIQQKEDQKLIREIFLSSANIFINEAKHQISIIPKGPVHLFNFGDGGQFGHGIIDGMQAQYIEYPHEIRSKKSFKEMSLSHMFSLIESQNHHELSKLKGYFHEKICLAFAPMLLILVSIPLSFIGRNTDHTKSFIFGLLLIFLIYYPILIVVKKFSIQHDFFIPFTMQLPNLILMVLAFLGMRRLNARI